MENKYIYIDPNNGRFANQLFPLFVAISMYEEGDYDKIYLNNFTKILNYDNLNNKIFDIIEFKKIDNVDNKKYFYDYKNDSIKHYKDCINSSNNIIIHNYQQNHEIINENVCRKYLSCPDKYKQQIFDLYGDLSDYIWLHVRRGDYINNNHYNTLSKEYIERVINKYFPNDKIICISDDIKWCKENLSNNENIVFGDKSSNYIIDFYIQTLTKGHICSGSSFSIAGVILNPNKDKKVIIPKPFFKTEDTFPEVNLILLYAIQEPIEL